MKRSLTILFNLGTVFGLILFMPFMLIYTLFISDYELNENWITGKEMFKPWE